MSLYGGFSENNLIEQPTIELFRSLGWKTTNLMGEFGGKDGGGKSPEGRESKRDAVLPDRLRLALHKLNPDIDPVAVDGAFSALTRERRTIDPVRANAELQALLLNGVKVEVRGRDGALRSETDPRN
jgi:type I restriction enzyme R subunit